VVRQLKKYGDDNSVAAILIHVNSPGGVVAATQEMYDEIMRIRLEEDKPVVVSMSSVAASGGYYIACAADQVVANPGTLTGSIGVILEYPIVGELLEKLGIEFETIKSGEVKDVGSPWREPSERDRRMLQAAIDDTYEQFVQVVMEGRNLTREDVLAVADGSIFTGRQALDLGLVDRLGSFEDAVRITGELAGIDGEPGTVKERPRRGVSVFDLLEGRLSGVFDVSELNLGPELKYLYK
jgi:protease-4